LLITFPASCTLLIGFSLEAPLDVFSVSVFFVLVDVSFMIFFILFDLRLPLVSLYLLILFELVDLQQSQVIPKISFFSHLRQPQVEQNTDL